MKHIAIMEENKFLYYLLPVDIVLMDTIWRAGRQCPY